MNATLLQLLEKMRPDLTPAEREALVEATPDAKPAEKPVQARRGSRPRTSASMERRRSWAASGRMPPRLAARFTLAEAAVLSVIAVEVAGKGACTLTIGHIAALAGVSETSVRNAMREAVALGLIRVEERRLSAWRNAPNRVTILAPEWLSWLRLTRKGGGCKTVHPTNTKSIKQDGSHSTANDAKGFRKEGTGTNELFRKQTSPPARSQVPPDLRLPHGARDAG